MAETRNVPSLSTSKTITNPTLKAEKLLEYFVASLRDQSNFFLKDISSLKYLVYSYSDSPMRFKEEVISTLEKYYKRHYNDVSISVSLNNSDDDLKVIKVSTIEIRIIAIDNNLDKVNYSKTIDLEKYILK